MSREKWVREVLRILHIQRSDINLYHSLIWSKSRLSTKGISQSRVKFLIDKSYLSPEQTPRFKIQITVFSCKTVKSHRPSARNRKLGNPSRQLKFLNSKSFIDLHTVYETSSELDLLVAARSSPKNKTLLEQTRYEYKNVRNVSKMRKRFFPWGSSSKLVLICFRP